MSIKYVITFSNCTKKGVETYRNGEYKAELIFDSDEIVEL